MPDLIYYHVPPVAGQSIYALSLLYAAFLGVVGLDFINHLHFDYQLLTSKGWSNPVKAATRIAYFNCRIFSIIVLSMALAFTSAQLGRHFDCNMFVHANQALLVPLLNSASLIFVMRTISLYGSKRNVAIPLVGAWLLVFAFSIVSLPFWGTARSIPRTDYCIYDAKRNVRGPFNLTYKALCLCLNVTVLLLTLHRLMENGISGLWRRRKTIGVTPLPKVLVQQGFFLFFTAVIVDVTFLVLYYSQPSTNPGIQLAGSALVFSVQPMLAARLYRNVGKAVQTRSIATMASSQMGGPAPPAKQADSLGTSSAARKSYDEVCCCKSAFNVDGQVFANNQAATSDSRLHDPSCLKHGAYNDDSSPQLPILPMHTLSRGLGGPLSPMISNGSSLRSPFEERTALPPVTGEIQAAHDAGIHVTRDTIRQTSAGDAAADTTHSTRPPSASGPHGIAVSRWPGLAATRSASPTP